MGISKTEAIRQARKFVSMPHRRSSTDYVVYGPWKSSEPNGASTEHQESSYTAALAVRTRWVARIALHLMGKLNEDSKWAVEDFGNFGAQGAAVTVENCVEAGLNA